MSNNSRRHPRLLIKDDPSKKGDVAARNKRQGQDLFQTSNDKTEVFNLPADLALPASSSEDEGYDDGHGDEGSKGEPNKFFPQEKKLVNTSSKFVARSGPDKYSKRKIRRDRKTYISVPRHTGTISLFRVFAIVLLVVGGVLLHKYWPGWSVVKSWLNASSHLVEHLVGRIDSIAQVKGDEGKVITDVKVATPLPLALSEMDCHRLLVKIEKLDTARLDFSNQFVVAECFYLKGELDKSFKILERNKTQLSQESLLLYVMLLLKRRHFNTVRDLLHSKCYAYSKTKESFFPCLGKSLYQLVSGSRSTFKLMLPSAYASHPYTAIAWLIQALRKGEYDLEHEAVARAIMIGRGTRRPVALAYAYESLMEAAFAHGTDGQVARIDNKARLDLHEEYPNSLWWMSFLARLKLEDGGGRKKMMLRFLTNTEEFSRIYNNLGVLNITGRESLKMGYSGTLAPVISRARKYHNVTYRSAAKEALQFLDGWIIRVRVAENRYRDAMKKLKLYAKYYHKDHFYYFYRGVAALKVLRGKKANNLASNNFLRSISQRSSWEGQYAYAMSLLRAGNKTKFAYHLQKLEKMTVSGVHKRWLFLLKKEVDIERGDFRKAIVGLHKYIEDNPDSFKAHELLISAYTRSEQLQKAAEVRRAHDELQRSIPYHSTVEGSTSPLGPLALF